MTTVHHSNRPRKQPAFTLFPDGPTFRFSPALARVLGGANEALLLLQVDYWLHNLRGVIVDLGVPWIELSSRRVYDLGFDHMSTRGISKLISRLEGLGVLRVGFLAGRPGRWVTLDYEGLDHLGVKCDLSAWERRSERSSQADGGSGTEFPGAGNRVQNGVPGFSPQNGSDIHKESEEDPLALRAGEGEESGPPTERTLKEAFMINALIGACRVDPLWHMRDLEEAAAAMIVSYEPGDVDRHAEWWQERDWRGQKGDVPRISEVAQTLRQSVEWHESRGHVPERVERYELRRRADQDCLICGGVGWYEDLAASDPRAPRWFVCSCVRDPDAE
jgi:hypothetical protein